MRQVNTNFGQWSCFTKALQFLLLMILVCPQGYAQDPNWKFDRNYKDDLLYLHALLNYDMSPWWYYDWEKNLNSKNGIKLSFGSIELNKFLTDFKANLNVELTEGVWFRNINIWYGSQHRNLEEKTFLLGLDKSLYKPLYVFLMFDPALNKDEIDAYLGFYVADSTQENYLRLGLYFDDFDYDVRNEVEGESIEDPLGVRWFGRYQFDRFTFYSDGKLTSGFERAYPDSLIPPGLNWHKQQENQFNVKAYYHFSEFNFIQAGYWYYYFEEGMRFDDPGLDYLYNNELHQFYLKYVFTYGHKNRFRAGFDYVRQDAEASGYKNYNYKRKEIMPSFFYERLFEKQIVELGAVFSLYDFNYDSAIPEESFIMDDAVEKAILGWTYMFSENSHLKVSLSHVFSIQGFGGGNVQYYVYF